jgi:hypothetical protein
MMPNDERARLRRSRWLDAIAVTTIAIAWVLGLTQPWASPAPPWTSPPRLTPARIAAQVGAAYGDPHARLVSTHTDQTEGPPFHPMYVLTIEGHFHEGPLSASTLSFSAEADQMDVWNITAYDGNTAVWSDDQLPVSYTQVARTPTQ